MTVRVEKVESVITYSDCGITIKKRTNAPCVFTQSGNERKEESFNTDRLI